MKKALPLAILFSSMSLSMPALAAQFTGTVSILEVWNNGTVAFSLSPSVNRCNNQFIINVADGGLKNQLAVLLAAKRTGTLVSVYTDGACIEAVGYGGQYNWPQFLYAMD